VFALFAAIGPVAGGRRLDCCGVGD